MALLLFGILFLIAKGKAGDNIEEMRGVRWFRLDDREAGDY